jgi:hypothetical protein
LVVLAEEELVRRDGHDRAQAEQKLEDVGPDSAENGHVLQEFDTRLLHGDTARVAAIMSFGGSVRNQLQDPNFSKGILWVTVWCVAASAYFALHGRHRLTLSPEEFALQQQEILILEPARS